MTDATLPIQPSQPDGTDRIREAWARELPDVPTGSIAVITRIWKLAKLLSDDRRRTLTRLGLDDSTLDLLSTLRRSGPPYRMAAGEIAAESLVTQGAVSQRLARAEAAGLVRRQATRADRRGVLVSLTPRGRRLNERAVAALLEHEETLVSSLDAAEQAQLAGHLKGLLADLTARLGGTDLPSRP